MIGDSLCTVCEQKLEDWDGGSTNWVPSKVTAISDSMVYLLINTADSISSIP